MASTWDTTKKKVLYLVKWEGWPDRKDWTEEPYDNFTVGAREFLREFHRKNPRAARDGRIRVGKKG